MSCVLEWYFMLLLRVSRVPTERVDSEGAYHGAQGIRIGTKFPLAFTDSMGFVHSL